jgi:hypothetical protein
LQHKISGLIAVFQCSFVLLMNVQVQDGAGELFGPILERSAKAERIRSVQLLLKRFSGLFSAPQRVTALGAARDYEQVRGMLLL